MIETTLICRHTGARQAVADAEALPGTWLHVTTLRTADGCEHDMHFSSWTALAGFATAQNARARLAPPVPFLQRMGVPAA